MIKKILSIADYHREIQDEAIKEAYKSTCLIFNIINNNPKPNATGVFIRIENFHFLISAAHVFENHTDENFIWNENEKFNRLGGELIMNSLPDGMNREKDKIDVAILRLDDESIEIAKKKYKFLNDSEIEINHKIIDAPLYTAVGFPKTYNEFSRYKNELQIKPFIITTQPASVEIYKVFEREISLNIIVIYDKNKVFNHKPNQQLTGPDPFGISGGGLWYVPPQKVESGSKIEKKLVGILNKWPPKNRKYWIATKIDIYTEIIREKYNLKIEQSKQVKIEL